MVELPWKSSEEGEEEESSSSEGYNPGKRFKQNAKIGKKLKGHATKFKTIFLVIILPLILIVGGWLLLSSGAIPTFGIGQALSGKGGEAGFFLSGIADSHAIRSFKNKIMNPFQIQPETAQVEKAPDEKEERGSPLQSFSISARVPTKRIEYGEKSGSIEVTGKNEGTATIGELEIKLEGQREKDRECIRFTTGGGCDDVGDGSYCELTFSNLNPGTLRKKVISNVRVKDDCEQEAREGETMQYNVKVKGETWYYTGSRLAVETIDTNYSTLLIKNEVLKLENRPAISMRGTAVRINLDAGKQPIFDTTDSTSVIINWENVGSGKIVGRPIIYLLSPSNENRNPSVYGRCNVWESGMNAGIDFEGSGGIDYECDTELRNGYFCDKSEIKNHFEGIGELENVKGSPMETLSWLCEDQLITRCEDKGKCHLCAGALNMSQFEAFSCNLDVSDITSSERRKTSYLTAFAFYKYRQKDLVNFDAYYIQ